MVRAYYKEGEFIPGTPAQTLYYGTDQIGSVRRAFASPTSAPAYGYDPYGNALQATALTTDFGFAGMFHHADSGLYLTRYRAYDPVAGRWLSRDRLGEAAEPGGNLYTYSGGNPVSLTDPTGLGPEGAIWGAGIGGPFGAVGGAIIGGSGGVVGGTLALPGGGTIAGGAVGASKGATLGLWLGSAGGAVIGSAVEDFVKWVMSPSPMSSFPPGFWSGPRGAEEWGRRHGVDPKAAVRKFHKIKQDCAGAPDDDWGVNPETGDIWDPSDGGVIQGNLGD